jgi:hypothetical protein
VPGGVRALAAGTAGAQQHTLTPVVAPETAAGRAGRQESDGARQPVDAEWDRALRAAQ